jgi:hypothetical protein
MKKLMFACLVCGLFACHSSCICQSISFDSLKQERYKLLQSGLQSESFSLDEFTSNPPFTLEEALSDWRLDSLTCFGLRNPILFEIIKKKIQFEGQSLAFLVEKLGKPNEVSNAMYVYSEKHGDIISRIDCDMIDKPLRNVCYIVVYYHGRNCSEEFPNPKRFDQSLSIDFIFDAATSRILKVRG